MPAEIKIGFILPGISIPEENKELQFTMESASTVRNVTLTLYQVVASGTTLSAWANYDPFSGSRPQEGIKVSNNNGAVFIRVISLEDGDIGDTYNVTISTSPVEENFKSAVETVLVDNGLISEPETLFGGTITITDGPAEIPFDVDVSSYPIKKWTVTVNDEPLEYNGEVFINETETHMYVVGNNNGVCKFLARGADGVIPGDYQVKITGVSGEATDIKIVRFYHDGDETLCDTRIDDIFTDDGLPNIRKNIVFMFQNCVGMDASPADNKSQIRVGFLINPKSYMQFTLNKNNTVTEQEFNTNIALTPVT